MLHMAAIRDTETPEEKKTGHNVPECTAAWSLDTLQCPHLSPSRDSWLLGLPLRRPSPSSTAHPLNR